MSQNQTHEMPTGLYWKGKKTEVDRIVLPFQTIETINESRATREQQGEMFKDTDSVAWYNRLIWGDNKYVMSSLLDEFAGRVDLIYIDPPFATGADFSVTVQVGDVEWTKEASAIEEKAYRDTWGKGLDSYLQMMYDRLVLMRELLSKKGSIFVHLDWHIGHYLKVLMDDIFGRQNFRNEIVWCYGGGGAPQNYYPRKHDVIFWYTRGSSWTFNKQYRSYTEGTRQRGLTAVKGDQYELNKEGAGLDDWWAGKEVQKILSPTAYENLKYPTQKPEGLLKRIITGHSNEGDLVADFFCGSGTTGAVAEKTGRHWIMADLGRFSIHTTRKRLLDIEGCRPFVIQNLGKYERQYWTGIMFGKLDEEVTPLYEYIKFVLHLYNAEPVSGLLHIHGKKGKRLVHIGAVDVPVTLSEIQDAIAEVKKIDQSFLDVLGWEWEMGLHNIIEDEANAKGVKLRLFNIPRDIMDPQAIERGDITFYEMAYLDAKVRIEKNGLCTVELKNFAIPNLDLIPSEARGKIQKWSDYIDYWAIDWDWNQDTFHNMWQSYRMRPNRSLQLKSEPYIYQQKGNHLIMVKVIDIFGNDTTRVLEVKM